MIEALTAASAGILIAYGLLAMTSMYRFRSFATHGPWPRARFGGDAPRGELGSSAVMLFHGPRRGAPTRATTEEIGFHALRATAIPVDNGRWQLRIRAVLLNNGRDEIVFDDLHTAVYFRIAPTPPLLTISYHGNAIILQDNTLFKDARSYSIAPGDGIEMDVLTQVTRYEGAPSYYGMREEGGPVCVLFGLIADLYSTIDVQRSRRAVPSDSIYLFLCRIKGAEPAFDVITTANAHSFKWPPRGYDADSLADILGKHSAWRPEPR